MPASEPSAAHREHVVLRGEGGNAGVAVHDAGDPRSFHRTLPGYEVTPLRRLDAVAERLGLGEVWVKDESWRLGLPSFKILGGSWAVQRLLLRLAGRPLENVGFEELRRVAADLAPLTLCTATDGNHGRGVARMARLLALDAVVVVPDDMAPARRDAIASEGACVIVHPGDYDDAVERAAREAEAHGWHVVADVAYEGYSEVPRWVMDGYDTIFAECGEQLPGPPTVLFLQAGVGALAGSAIRHYLAAGVPARFAIVEPLSAACLLASARAGRPVALDSSQGSIMAGLNCGTPSLVAWPYINAAASAFIAITDDRARQAMRVLAAAGIESGESGAAGLGGLLEAGERSDVRATLDLGPRARILLLNTEGATDPVAYREIVGEQGG